MGRYPGKGKEEELEKPEEPEGPDSEFDNFVKNINADDFPPDLQISTMTIKCKFVDVCINVENFNKYIELTPDCVISSKLGDNPINARSLYEKKKKKRKNKKSEQGPSSQPMNDIILMENKKKKSEREYFLNQATIEIMPTGNGPINMKLFVNGSIQMTGCKSIDACMEVLEKICEKLKEPNFVLDEETEKQVERPFIDIIDKGESYDIDIKVNVKNIINFSTSMINSNFDCGFEIDRRELFAVLREKEYNCTYEPTNHASVDIQYVCEQNRKVYVFIFKSGKVVMTGARLLSDIIDVYKNINLVLYENYSKIRSIEQILKENFDEIMETISNDQ